MIAARVAPAAAALQQRRARVAAAPAAHGRRAVVVRVTPDNKGPQAGDKPTKDLTDVDAPSSLRDVGDVVREAMPRMEAAFQAPLLLPTFSRRREVFAGRLAMLGFAAACAWEIMTPDHLGLMGTTAALSGWSIPTVKLLYGTFVAHGVVGLLWPGSPTYDPANTRDYMRRPKGPPSDAVSPFGHPAKFFGISPNWGFTKKNELFNGRLAMLGFAAALVNEMKTGFGPIGQVAWWMGAVQPADDFYRTVGMMLLGFAAVATGLSYVAGHSGTITGEEDIY
ncbi:MAG: hypothetical protein J3K34DRAFT_458777 [Monoraphidium minutum]|nr:MAG: hypothetical protein J3K34DRAFT_458777 [Monoraphidium minutum]